jgi:hypothetical protein
MRTISIPVTIVTGNPGQKPQLVMQRLQWPARCACCGGPNDGRSLDLRHDVRATAGDVFREVTTTGIPVYPLAWRLPCCRSCIKHQGDSAGIPATVLFLGAFLLWAGIGYLLFLADLAYNAVAIAAFVGIGLVLGFAAWKLYPELDSLAKRRAQSYLKPTCTARGLPVSIQSELQRVQFTFQNDSFADEFRTLNQL